MFSSSNFIRPPWFPKYQVDIFGQRVDYDPGFDWGQPERDPGYPDHRYELDHQYDYPEDLPHPERPWDDMNYGP